MLRPSPNHGTQRLPNDDDDELGFKCELSMYHSKESCEANL